MPANQAHKNRLDFFSLYAAKARGNREARKAERDPELNPSGSAKFVSAPEWKDPFSDDGYAAAIKPAPDRRHSARLRAMLSQMRRDSSSKQK